MTNPHFDHDRVIWKDEYSGQYAPIDYRDQFDPQWKLFLEGREGFTAHTGVETDDAWIDDRVYDLTGIRGLVTGDTSVGDRNLGGRQQLDLRFAAGYFARKQCVDLACGAGRWTRALMALGASVKSVDISEHGLASVKRFNTDIERLNLFDLPTRPDLQARFDFALLWGVAMSTHDPFLAFARAASTVRQGGGLYVMVYAPTYHNSPQILEQRRHYHRHLTSAEDRLRYVYEIADSPANAINYMDMLNPFYNWVIDEATIHGWFRRHGFSNVMTLNASEAEPVAYHVFGVRRDYALPVYDDHGSRVPQPVAFDPASVRPLAGRFEPESGFAWQAYVPELADTADDLDAPRRSRLVLLENGQPLWFRHTPHEEIRRRGCGTYSHWRDRVIWSTPDNSDPNLNQRTYQIAIAR